MSIRIGRRLGTLRTHNTERPLCVEVNQYVGPGYAAVTVTCYGTPRYPKGSQHLVPRVCVEGRKKARHGRSRLRWWA